MKKMIDKLKAFQNAIQKRPISGVLPMLIGTGSQLHLHYSAWILHVCFTDYFYNLSGKNPAYTHPAAIKRPLRGTTSVAPQRHTGHRMEKIN